MDATRPTHYQGDGMQAIDVIDAFGLGDGFRLGNVIKYTTRYTHTNNIDDLRKARTYLDMQIDAAIIRQGQKELAK